MYIFMHSVLSVLRM